MQRFLQTSSRKVSAFFASSSFVWLCSTHTTGRDRIMKMKQKILPKGKGELGSKNYVPRMGSFSLLNFHYCPFFLLVHLSSHSYVLVWVLAVACWFGPPSLRLIYCQFTCTLFVAYFMARPIVYRLIHLLCLSSLCWMLILPFSFLTYLILADSFCLFYYLFVAFLCHIYSFSVIFISVLCLINFNFNFIIYQRVFKVLFKNIIMGKRKHIKNQRKAFKSMKHLCSCLRQWDSH